MKDRRRPHPFKSLRFLFFYCIGALLAAVLYAWTHTAAAQTIATDAARLTWSNATQLVNGDPIPAPPDPLSLATTTVQRVQVAASATCSATTFNTPAQVLNVPAAVTTMLFEALRPAGKHCFRVRHVQENGGTSSWSAILSKAITIPAPPRAAPPTVTIE